MKTIDDGGPAFPVSSTVTAKCPDSGNVQEIYTTVTGGMTLRDYFAGQALAGLLAKEGCTSDVLTRTLAGDDAVRDARLFAHQDAARCYVVADAMLAARKQVRG